MIDVVVILLVLMVSVYVGLNKKIESNLKTGYFVVVFIIVVIAVLVKLV